MLLFQKYKHLIPNVDLSKVYLVLGIRTFLKIKIPFSIF